MGLIKQFTIPNKLNPANLDFLLRCSQLAYGLRRFFCELLFARKGAPESSPGDACHQ